MLMPRRYGTLGDVVRHVAQVLHLASPDHAVQHVRRHRHLIPLRYDTITPEDMLALCRAIDADLGLTRLEVGVDLYLEEMELV